MNKEQGTGNRELEAFVDFFLIIKCMIELLAACPARGYMSVVARDISPCRAVGTKWEQLNREQEL